MNYSFRKLSLLLKMSAIICIVVSASVFLLSLKPLGHNSVTEKGGWALAYVNELTRAEFQPGSTQLISSQTLMDLRDLIVFKTREVAFCRLLIICQVVIGIFLSAMSMIIALMMKSQDRT